MNCLYWFHNNKEIFGIIYYVKCIWNYIIDCNNKYSKLNCRTLMLLNFNNDSAKCVTYTNRVELVLTIYRKSVVIYIHIHVGSLRVCNECNVTLVYMKMSVFKFPLFYCYNFPIITRYIYIIWGRGYVVNYNNTLS